MVLSTFFWAGAFIAGKLSVPYIPTFTLTFLRFFIATSILYFVVAYKDKSNYKLTKKDIPIFLFTGIIGMFGYHIFFFTALKYTTAINSSLIGATNPIITTILCIIFLKDKITFKRAIGIILSFLGVFLTITNANLSTMHKLSLNKGDLIMLLAVCMWAAYSVFSKKVMHKFTPLILTFYSFLFCTIFTLPFALYEKPWLLISKVPYYSFLAVVYMSLFASVIGYLVQQMSIKQIGPSKTSIFINLVPIFSIMLSVTILNETISAVKILTALLIISGVYICQKN
jgi:drug/metabolite transporter (DMT)-like permease